MSNKNRLKGFDDVGESTLSTVIQDNMVEYFDWALLEKGNFFNISVPTTGQFGGNKHNLRLVDDPRYDSGQVWEGFRSNWVWQSGLSFSETDGYNPLRQAKVIQSTVERMEYPFQKRVSGVSGVYVGGEFRPASGVGTYAHHIDHPRGRVVFDTAIPTTSTVQAEFSYKWINVTRANNAFFREIQYRSQRTDRDFNFAGSGDWSQLSDTRLQLPAIAVETVKKREMAPYQLGGSQYVESDVLFHVLAETEFARDKLLDILSLQKDSHISLFDPDRIGRENVYPLDWRGSPKVGALRHPELVAPTGDGGYLNTANVFHGDLRFKDTAITAVTTMNPNLYHGVVRTSTEVILPGI